MTVQEVLELVLGTIEERIISLEEQMELLLSDKNYLEAADPDIRIRELNSLVEEIEDFMKEV